MCQLFSPTNLFVNGDELQVDLMMVYWKDVAQSQFASCELIGNRQREMVYKSATNVSRLLKAQ